MSLIVLDAPASLERELRNQSVSSLLSPAERFVRDRAGYKKDHQKALCNDADKKAADSVRSDGGQSRTSFEARRGILLHSSVITDRLKQLNSSFIFQRSIARPELMGVYLKSDRPEHQPEGLMYTGVAFNIGPNPEFSVLKKADDYVAHDGQVHIGECKGIAFIGWRTCLTRLIRGRFISQAQAERLFGTNQTSSILAAALGQRSKAE